MQSCGQKSCWEELVIGSLILHFQGWSLDVVTILGHFVMDISC